MMTDKLWPAPRREQPSWEIVQHEQSVIVGETPTYEPRNNSLYWVSLYEPALRRINLVSGVTDAWALPSAYVGSFALYDDGSGAVFAAANGIHDLNFVTGATRLIHEAPYDQSASQFNDGRCDPVGRFWIGTFPTQLDTSPRGKEWYYRLDSAGISPVLSGMTIANGTAFSGDGRLMYIADRVNDQILVYDYDVVTGAPTNKRVFASIRSGESPDGAAVDARGGYWVAMYGGGEVRRYAPDGRLDRVLETPVLRPTMCAFGGPNLDRLYLTSSRLRMTQEELDAEPMAGAVFVADIGEIGIPEPHIPHSWFNEPIARPNPDAPGATIAHGGARNEK
jgi:sugar lactone lactonase YvrE